MKTPVSSLIVALIAGSCLLPGGALAAGGGGGDTLSEAPKDPAIARAQEAIAAKDWTRAAAVMRKALAGHPGNADYHNLYAYARRIDPGHRNAHEYIGEAYSLPNRSCCRRWCFATAA